MKETIASMALVIVFCGLGITQEPPAPPEGPNSQMGPGVIVLRPRDRGPTWINRAPLEWWKDPELMRKIGVSDEQVQKIEKIFQDYRLQGIDLRAAVEKQEAILEPLIEADQPDESQVLAQIDRVSQARADLEKSNARMLLAIRRVLTLDQWKKVRDLPGVAPIQGGRRFEPLDAPPPGENFRYFMAPPRPQ